MQSTESAATDNRPPAIDTTRPKKTRKRQSTTEKKAPQKKAKTEGTESFHLHAKCLFLTYPRTGGDRQALLDHLNNVFAIVGIEHYIVAKELHHDNDVGAPDLKDVGDDHLNFTGEHFHVFLDLKGKCNLKKSDTLDFNGHHGNYKSTRCRYAAIEYCLKEDTNPLVTPDWDINEEIKKGKRAQSIKGFSKGAMNDLFSSGEVTDEFLMQAFEAKILNPSKYKQIYEFRKFFDDQKAKTRIEDRVTAFTFDCTRPWVLPGLPQYSERIDFTVPEEERRLRHSVYWLFGVNCTGKSYIGEHQKDDTGKPIPFYTPCMKNEDWSNYKGEQIIIFNEFGGSKTPKDLITYTEGCQVNCKYGATKTLPKDVILVITSNATPFHVFRHFISDPSNTSNWEAFLQRCALIELTGRNPAMPQASTEPFISGPYEESELWRQMSYQQRAAYQERIKKQLEDKVLAEEEAMAEKRIDAVIASIGVRSPAADAAEVEEVEEEDPLA